MIQLIGRGGREEVTITEKVDDMVFGTNKDGIRMVFTSEKYSYEFGWTEDIRVT